MVLQLTCACGHFGGAEFPRGAASDAILRNRCYELPSAQPAVPTPRQGVQRRCWVSSASGSWITTSWSTCP